MIPLTEEEKAAIQKNRERKAEKVPQELKEPREEKKQETEPSLPAKPVQSSDESVWQNF